MEKPITRAPADAGSNGTPRWTPDRVAAQRPYQSQVRRVAQPDTRLQTDYRQAPRPRKRRRRRVAVILVLVILIAAGLTQANGSGGAFAADMLRGIIGPAATARIEALYLDLLDQVHSVQYRLGGQSIAAPWTVSTAAPGGTAVPPPQDTGTAGELAATVTAGSALPASTVPIIGSQATAKPAATPAVIAKKPVKTVVRAASKATPMPLPAIQPVIMPALAGEGEWTTDGLPGALHGSLLPCAKTFLRPDPARPYALATILQVDMRVARLHIVAGIQEPGGPRGMAGSGLIPQADINGQRLLAVFNGGFKYADGAYGLMSDGTVYVPPVWGAGTIAVTRGGKVFMGNWGLDKRLSVANHDLVAWRQNANLLIDHGHISPQTQDGSAWGLTLLNSTYTWRSGIGMTRNGTLLYAGGAWLSAETLARALHAAGAVTAMELDINPFWVRAFTYSRDSSGQLIATPLNPGMQGTGTEYLYGHVRDFFYITRRTGA